MTNKLVNGTFQAKQSAQDPGHEGGQWWQISDHHSQLIPSVTWSAKARIVVTILNSGDGAVHTMTARADSEVGGGTSDGCERYADRLRVEPDDALYECWVNVDDQSKDSNKKVGNKFVVKPPNEVLGARVGLLNDMHSGTIDYLLIVNVDDGHSALEILRAN
jgi:hypothetical protein